MTEFVALYRGRTIGSAELVSVTADERVVGAVAVLMDAHKVCPPPRRRDDRRRIERGVKPMAVGGGQ